MCLGLVLYRKGQLVYDGGNKGIGRVPWRYSLSGLLFDQYLVDPRKHTFERDMSEDDLVVCFSIIFFSYPFKDRVDGVLSFHCLSIAEVTAKVSLCRLVWMGGRGGFQ